MRRAEGVHVPHGSENALCSSSDFIPHRKLQMNILVLFSRKILLSSPFFFSFFIPVVFPTPVPFLYLQGRNTDKQSRGSPTAGGMSHEPALSYGCVQPGGSFLCVIYCILHLQQDCPPLSYEIPLLHSESHSTKSWETFFLVMNSSMF